MSNVNQDTSEGLAFLNFLLPILGGLGGSLGTIGAVAAGIGGLSSAITARNQRKDAIAAQAEQRKALAESEAQSAAAYRTSLRTQGGQGTGDFGGASTSTFNTALKSLTGR